MLISALCIHGNPILLSTRQPPIKLHILNRAALDSALRLRYKFLHLKPCLKLSQHLHLCAFQVSSILFRLEPRVPSVDPFRSRAPWCSLVPILLGTRGSGFQLIQSQSHGSRNQFLCELRTVKLFLELGCRKGAPGAHKELQVQILAYSWWDCQKMLRQRSSQRGVLV